MIHQRVQKRIIKLSIALAVMVAIVIVMNFFVSAQFEAANEEVARLNGQVSKVKEKIAEMNAEQRARVEAANFFETYQDTPSAKPENFTRDSAKSRIANMRRDFGLNTIMLSNTGFKELRVPQATERSILLRANASIKFTSVYDIPVYDFLAAIDDTLPGQIDITSISIKKQGMVDDKAIEDITAGKEHNLIAGEISFNWYGVVDPVVIARPLDPTDSGQVNIQNIFDAMQASKTGAVMPQEQIKGPAGIDAKKLEDLKLGQTKGQESGKVPSNAVPVPPSKPVQPTPTTPTTTAPKKLEDVKPSNPPIKANNQKGGGNGK